MGKRIYKFEKFKLLLERDEDESEFDFANFDLDENPESDDVSDVVEDEVEDDDMEEGDEEGDGGDKVFNEDPSYYIEEALKKVERKILSLFKEPVAGKDGRTENDPSSYYDQGVELIDVKLTDMPLNKTLIIKYHDTDFTYHLMVTVDLKQGVPEKPDVEMDYTMVEYCGVKFKKYDISNNLLGQLDRKKVPLKTIDQDFIDSLNGELDSKYSIDDGFEIEYGED